MQPVGKTYEQLNTHHRKPQASRRTRCGKWRLNGVLKPIYFLIPPECERLGAMPMDALPAHPWLMS